MKKDGFTKAYSGDSDFKRGMSFSMVDAKTFTKAGSPNVVVIQPPTPSQPSNGTQVPAVTTIPPNSSNK